jgi:phosphatidylglycerophosphate synthase
MTRPALAEYRSLRHSAGGHLLTRQVSQRLGAVCAWLAQGLGLTPSQVTLLGTATFLLGAGLFASQAPGAAGVVTAAVLFQLGYALDCADGQLARATGRTSAFGAWLDVACDYARNIALATALAVWLARHQLPGPGVIAALLFAAGTAVYLHTVTSLRRGAAAPAEARSGPREWVLAALDTPTVLLAFALLRPFPELLGLAAAAAGMGYLVIATILARRRL